MISPIILYTNLFTLYGSNEKTNKYIDIYYVWLLYIIKYAKLNDCSTDKEYYEYNWDGINIIH